MRLNKLTVWANAVKERDGKCTQCGALGHLHAHHIKPKSTHPELMFDVDNGVALCYPCHVAEHEKSRPLRHRGPRATTLSKRVAELESQVALLMAKLNESESRANVMSDFPVKSIGWSIRGH